MEFEGISWLGVAIAALAWFVFGALWYGPLFSKPWMRAVGITEEEASQANLPVIFVVTFVLNILAAIGTAAVIGDEASIGTGLWVGTLIGALIVLPTLGVLSLFERRSTTLLALNGGYNLIGFVVMGAIIGAFQ